MQTPDPNQTFLHEAADLLGQIEEIALAAEQHPLDADAVNRLFRAFHTIKGSGAMFGHEAVATFTHHFESALDRVRTGQVPMSGRFIELILTARDHIGRLLEGTASPEDSAKIVAAIEGLLAGDSASAPGAGEPTTSGDESRACWRVRFRPNLKIACTGSDPLALVDELRLLGPCEVRALLDAVPPLEQLHAEDCHIGWEVVFREPVARNAIRDVFIFVEDESEITIVADAPATRGAAAARSEELPPSRAASVTSETTGARKSPAKDAGVRVPSARLDRLVNLVGELVMNQSRLIAASDRLGDAELSAPVEDLERLIAEVRDTVLGIRMMPIGTTFTRFKRLVHDLARDLGKEIDLVTEGGDTELDKTVLDQLGDPLVHMIRNSVDHGIESPEERARAGKHGRGTIRLAAAHIGSHVVVTIQDDGRGLDPERLRAKAVEKGLIAADAVLTPRQICELILLPGFSTAQKVTAVSGRGVGMDVVKREIDSLGGTLSIESEPGRSTTISATLPLTLAIIDGLLVEVAGDRFIIPMSAVQENVALARSERGRHNGRQTVVVRDELVPYLSLRDVFAVTTEEPENEKVVIVCHGNDRFGLVVDRVLGSHQTVIQSLGRFYRNIEVVSGATIMGDGRVVLILDLRGLLNRAGSTPPVRCAAA